MFLFSLVRYSGGAAPPPAGPVFSSGTTASFDENDTGTVYTAAATGIGTITYSIVGGADSTEFNIDGSTGVLEFNTPPDYEIPTDADTDNDYVVTIRATDGTTALTTDITVTVTVDDVGEVASRAPSYWNPGARDYRVGLITVSSSLTITGGNDGLIEGIRDTGIFFANGQTVSGAYVRFDFDPGAIGIKKRITELNWYQSVGTSNGTWKLQGSDDASSWTDISSSDFTFNVGAGQTIDNGISGNTAYYRYYQLLGVSGTTSSFPSQLEIQFKIAQEGGENNTPAWTGVGGRGRRTDIITYTDTIGLGGTALVDGAYANVIDFSGGTTPGRYIQFDFGSGIKVVIDGVRLRQSNSSAQGNFQLQRSFDGTTWVDVGAEFALGGATDSNGTITTDNVAARYWRVTTYSGTVSASPWIHEMEFRIAYIAEDAAPVFHSLPNALVNDAHASGVVYTARALDPDGSSITYSISGGVDAALFTIDGSTGEVEFVTPPDYDAPDDDDSDNVYELIIEADDGTLTSTLAVSLEVAELVVYRYYRMYFGHGQANLQIGEIEMRETAAGADATGGGTASASSEFSGSFPASYGFDNNDSNAWAASGGPPAWLKYDFGGGNEKVIEEIYLKNTTTPSQRPKSYVLQGSNDDSAWDDLAFNSGQVANTGSAGTSTQSVIPDIYEEVVLDPTDPHRYWRFQFTARGAGSNFISVNQIQLLDAPGGTNLVISEGGRATADEQQTGFEASKGFDADDGTRYVDNGDDEPHWLQWDFGPENAQIVEAYKMKAFSSAGVGFPRGWKLMCSDDGVNWCTVDWQTAVAAFANSEERSYTI